MVKSMEQIDIPEIPFKRRLLYFIHSFLNLSKIDKILTHMIDTDGAIILMYHSVASDKNKWCIDPRNHIPESIFEKHMKFLATERNVISLDTLIDFIKVNKPLPRGTTVITFDDGYFDNLTNAAPILKKYDLPATIYLATGYITREENQWIDELYTYFNERTNDRLIVPEIFENQRELYDFSVTWTTYSEISKYLIVSTYEQRTHVLNSIKKQLIPNRVPPKLTMSWNDIRTLINENKNITLGSHTFNHIDLSKIDDLELIFEIQTSTDDIEREIGQRPVHFSCPYSRAAKNLPEILNKLGYESSVSDSTDLLINSNSFPYTLGRVEAPSSLSRLAHYTSGNYPRISKIVTGGRY